MTEGRKGFADALPWFCYFPDWPDTLNTQQATQRHHSPMVTQDVPGMRTEPSETQSIAFSQPPVVPPHNILQSVLFLRIARSVHVKEHGHERDMVAMLLLLHIIPDSAKL